MNRIILAAVRPLLLTVGFVLVLVLAPSPHPVAVPADFQAAAAAGDDYAVAADRLSHAAEHLPYDTYTIYHAGLADISARRFDSAIRRLQAAANLGKWTPALHTALGDAYLGAGDRAAAIEHWSLALQSSPDDVGLLQRLADSYEATGRYREALDTLTALATPHAGNNPATYYRLALLTAALDPPRAGARLLTAAQLNPGQAPQIQMLIEAVEDGLRAGDQAYALARVGFALIQLKEWPLAELALSQAVETNPNYADAQAYLCLAQEMQSKDGLNACEKAVRLAPDSALAQLSLGLHWRRAAQPQKALIHLQQAQAIDPRNPAIAAEIGGAYAATGALIEAEQWYMRAVELAPDKADFWIMLANFCSNYAYHIAEIGLPAARQAASLAPQSAAAADALGYALLLTDDLANARKTLERAVALDPQFAASYYHLGLVYMRQDQIEAARAAFNRTIALDVQGDYGGLAIKALAQIGQ